MFSQKLKTDIGQNNNLSKAFAIVVKQWSYVDELKDLEKFINNPTAIQKILEKKESTKDITLFGKNNHLIASYNERQVGGEHYTVIISLIDLTIVSLKSDKFFVNSYNSKKNILEICRNGYDLSGRYWQNGTYSLTTKQIKYSQKEY